MIIGIGVVSSPVMAVAFLVVVLIHELGHALLARALGGPLRLILQLAGGRVYADRALVLAAGPAASAPLIFLGALLNRTHPPEGYALFYAAIVWTGYQLAPFPTTDGGQLLRKLLGRWLKSAVWIWRLSWLLGFAWVAGIIFLDPGFIEPCVWLTGVALILGRGEAGYVRHLDAFEAWEAGDHRTVIAKVKAAPDFLDKRDRIPLYALGVSAALELEDPAALQELAGKLPAHEPSVIEAATWLLRNEKPYGARLAERALDALHAEKVKRRDIDEERWAEMAFRLAIHEARELRPESAVGLLERALDLGYENKDRIEAEPAFTRLSDNARFQQALARLR